MPHVFDRVLANQADSGVALHITLLAYRIDPNSAPLRQKTNKESTKNKDHNKLRRPVRQFHLAKPRCFKVVRGALFMTTVNGQTKELEATKMGTTIRATARPFCRYTVSGLW